jgi:hypothetical protein
MTTFPNSPKLLKGGIVLVDPESLTVHRIVTLQYNPHTVTRKLQVQGAGGAEGEAGGDHSEALRLKGPAVETIAIEAEIDATDQMEKGNPITADLGIQPQLAALESLINPGVAQILQSGNQLQSGLLEILPMESPLSLIVWSKYRILPVQLTGLTVTEEAFDPQLNPLRAKISLDMRVLSFDDLGMGHKGSRLFLNNLIHKEVFGAMGSGTNLGSLGLGKGDIS